jgi:hypothetical protein
MDKAKLTAKEKEIAEGHYTNIRRHLEQIRLGLSKDEPLREDIISLFEIIERDAHLAREMLSHE